MVFLCTFLHLLRFSGNLLEKDVRAVYMNCLYKEVSI